MSESYDPHNPNALFAVILDRVEDLKKSHKEVRDEMKGTHEHFYIRLREHDEELARLKTEDAVRGRQTKWALAIAGIISWVIGTFINWKH